MPSATGRLATLSVSEWAPYVAAENLAYVTTSGAAIVAKTEEFLESAAGRKLRGRTQLVFTSPPYPLNRKKAYGNEQGQAFVDWLAGYANPLADLLTENGSIVLEMGNAWEPGEPVMSTLAIESLLAFKKKAGLKLCQEFVWYNSSRLPSPAEWVTVTRTRVKDSFTRLWWLSRVAHPKADNRNVLVPYSKSMRRLLDKGRYNAGRRPSEHVISEKGFLTDNGGAISPNVLGLGTPVDHFIPENIVVGSNTESSDRYHTYCRALGLEPHPARMPLGLASFFIRLCTDPGDLVLDPFGGSSTTGEAAELNGRQWITIEASKDYAAGGAGRFLRPDILPKGPLGAAKERP